MRDRKWRVSSHAKQTSVDGFSQVVNREGEWKEKTSGREKKIQTTSVSSLSFVNCDKGDATNAHSALFHRPYLGRKGSHDSRLVTGS